MPMTVTYNETFNPYVLEYLLLNKSTYKSLVTDCKDPDYDPFALAEQYFCRSTDGRIQVEYHYTNEQQLGRLMARDHMSMQKMNRRIRHTIAQGQYYDIDMVNCHPMLLYNLCKMHGIKAPCLQNYVQNREQLLKSSNMSRETAKKIVIKMLYNEKLNCPKRMPCKWMKKLHKELKRIVPIVCSMYPAIKIIADDKPRSRHLSSILTTYENRVLTLIQEYFKRNKMLNDVCVLCFDGILIPAWSIDLQTHLRQCETYIGKQSGLTVKLINKPMDEHLFSLDNLHLYYIFSALLAERYVPSPDAPVERCVQRKKDIDRCVEQYSSVPSPDKSVLRKKDIDRCVEQYSSAEEA
jgi:hypothetical protein